MNNNNPIKQWPKPKFADEVDVRFAHFNDDIPHGATLTGIAASIENGDMDIISSGYEGYRAYVVLGGGTMHTLVRFELTFTNPVLNTVNKAICRLAA